MTHLTHVTRRHRTALSALVAGPLARPLRTTSDHAVQPTQQPTRPQALPLCTGEQLRALRLSRGLSRRELAELIGYSQWTIRDWEHGRLPVPRRIASTLGEVVEQITRHLAHEDAQVLDWLGASSWAG